MKPSPFSVGRTNYNGKTNEGELTETSYDCYYRSVYDQQVMSDYDSIITDARKFIMPKEYQEISDFIPIPDSEPVHSFQANSDYSQTRRVYDPTGYWSS